MATDAEAQTVIEKFHGADYDGRTMTVNEARPMAPRENSGPRPGGFSGGQRPNNRY